VDAVRGVGDHQDGLQRPQDSRDVGRRGRITAEEAGGPAMGNDKITSFDFMDTIVNKLGNKSAFPNLKTIVLAGHSAGGQFSNRYEMANLVHEEVGIPMTYVVSNPSSFAYLDSIRPTSLAYPVTAAAPGYMAAPPSEPFERFGEGGNCVTYDRWPYGLSQSNGIHVEIVG
jgi:hypothetical protein